MKPTTLPRLLAAGGLVLALVMVVLMIIGTYDQGLFYTWGALALVGVGLFSLGQKLDGIARQARAEVEREMRIQQRRAEQGGDAGTR